MKIHWTNRAVQHLLTIYDYIAKDSIFYAERMIDRLTRRSEHIAEFPRIGRKVPEYDSEKIRELFEGNYRIIYHLKKEQIDILAVVHSARLLPNKLQ